MVAVPRLVIAAPASGSGKTTVACGLMAALRARGLAVSGHKVGPDYIDPGYHALATGRPARNLDPFLCGEDLIAPLFLHGAQGAEIAVIEGVMGLFDGVDQNQNHHPERTVVSPPPPASASRQGTPDPASGPASASRRGTPDPASGPASASRQATPGPVSGSSARAVPDPDFGSTAHVARLLGAPVVLVVDSARAGRSVAAVVRGFDSFDPRTRIAGVILNRVGSDRHERLLRDAIASIGIPVLGAIRRTDDIATPSRHLGLVPAAERRPAAEDAVARLGALVAASCDLDALLALARRAPALPGTPWDPATALATPPGVHDHVSSGLGVNFGSYTAPDPSRSWSATGEESPEPVVAVAGGAAFTFGYTEQVELLEAAGLRVATVDPLRDENLPEGTRGLIIGGGFPEVHAPELSANEPLRLQVAALAARGAPVVAECAGLLYLARTLDGQPMCGVLNVNATMTGRLTLGYRRAEAVADSVIAAAGDQVHGHEFHRTAVAPHHGRQAAWQFASGESFASGTEEGHIAGSCVASYLHVHWAGYPAAAARFARACEASPRQAITHPGVVTC
jgi:cobyrinic acid a,c-diamide synthase